MRRPWAPRVLVAGLLAAVLSPVAGAATPAAAATPDPRLLACSPVVAPVDPQATLETRCLAARLDGWRSTRRMGIGQQLNVSNAAYLDPLTRLAPDEVAVVGFDVGELADGETYAFTDPPLQRLLQLAEDGAVLTASWHGPNPHTAGSSFDRTWHDLGALLDPTTPEAQAFWADYDRMLGLLTRLQSGDGGLFPPAAVVFRPLHEANGDWFWWGHPKPATYRAVWALMQQRAADAGVHNLLWSYAFAARAGSWIQHPGRLVPAHVDVAGIDTYDPERGTRNAADRVDLTGWEDVASRVRRMAVTEVGPQGSADGTWRPARITRTVREARVRPLWSMLWFDDGTGADGISGRKQISSLRGGRAWLHGCPGGLCSIRP
ncbi:glycosyl hydrolase [Nocardioides luti]|nr:glycosyl hydrolase [Nocardioides luti]